MGLYQNEQGGFACLALLKIVYFFIGVIDHIVGTRLTERGQAPTNKEETQSMQCNNMMHECDMAICCGLS